jgi:TolB-like protein
VSLFGELKRRNVFRAGIAYLIVSWVLAQVSDLVLDNIGAPDWVMQAILLGLALGFILVIFFSWAFEVTPEGIKRESEVDRSNSITHHTGRKLDRSITILLIIAVAYFFWESRYSNDRTQSDSSVSQQTATSAPAEVAVAADSDPDKPAEVDRHSIAVLPFDNRSNREEDEFFVEGIHDDLLTNLAKISALKVISRTSVARYRNTEIPIPEIARELGVATIMEGAVQRAGNTVRINVQLIDAQTDEHLWAEIFDRELTTENLFAIQSEISNKIAEALKATLSVEEKQRVNERPTENLAAYTAYQRGRQLMTRRTAETVDKALLEFQRAVKLDPEFALAWVGIAESAMLALELSDMKRPEAYSLAGEASEKALAINDQLGEAHLAKAELLSYQPGLEDEAEAAYQLAIELSPGYALAWQWYSRTLSTSPDRLEEALELSKKAVELDPLSTSTQNQLISVLGRLGRIEEAQEKLLHLIEQDPGFASSYEQMSTLKNEQLMYDQSIYWLHKAQALDPGNISYVLYETFPLLHIGNTDDIDHLINRMDLMDPNSSTLSFMEIWSNIYKRNYSAALESARTFDQKTGSTGRGKRPQFLIHTLLEDYPSARLAGELSMPGLFDLNRRSQPSLSKKLSNSCQAAWVLIHTNDRKMGQQLAQEVIEHVNNEQTDGIRSVNNAIGVCYMVLDRPEDALNNIEKKIQSGNIDGWWIEAKHPAYQLLKHEPRFQAVDAAILALFASQRENLKRLEAEDAP